MIDGDQHLDTPGDRSRVAAQRIDLYALFEQRRLRPSVSRFDFRERRVDRLRAAVEIVAAYPLGDPRQHRVDERVVIGAALASRDDIERDLDRALQFGDGLLEIEPLGGLEPLGERDDRAPLQTGQFRLRQAAPCAPGL